MTAASPDVDKMTEAFHKKLDGLLGRFFVWKRVRKKSIESAWMTEGLRASMKNRMKVFRKEGRSPLWKRIDTGIKNTIEKRKTDFLDKETEKIRSMGRQNQWYQILSCMLDNDAPKQWSVGDLEPDKDPKEIAESLAAHFTSITNQTAPLASQDIPKSKVPQVLIPQLLESNVAERLSNYKIPSSTVPGDLPKVLVKKVHKVLAIPLTKIYNRCLANTAWPRLWKNEVVVPIPKVQTPASYNDIRPISMTPLWSKVMESFVAHYTLLETSKNWKDNQHGGRPGSGTDHVLVSMWNYTLEALDGAEENRARASVLCGIDFSKSFSRCSFQEILKAYRDL